MDIEEFLKIIEDPTSFLFIKDLSRIAFPNNISPKNEKDCNILKDRFSSEDKEEIKKLIGNRYSDEELKEVFNNLSDKGKIEFNKIYFEAIIEQLRPIIRKVC